VPVFFPSYRRLRKSWPQAYEFRVLIAARFAPRLRTRFRFICGRQFDVKRGLERSIYGVFFGRNFENCGQLFSMSQVVYELYALSLLKKLDI